MNTSRLNFTDSDWERVVRDATAWWEGNLDRPLVYLTTVEQDVTVPPYHFMSNYPLDMPAHDVLDFYAPYLAAQHYYADAFPWLWINFGPGIVAGFLGANVNSVSSPSETVWFTPRAEVDIRDLNFHYDENNIWWQRVKELTVSAVERYGGRLMVAHTDLGGNLDILASFRTTEKLLLDLVDYPGEVERLAGQITKLWLRYYDELDKIIRPACRGTSCWTPLLSTGKTYMLQCDFSYMISPGMFTRFVMPDLTACCQYLEHGFYHLDGKGGIPHLDMLLSIPGLRGIQWVPGDGQPPVHHWLALLKRIRDSGKLCQVSVTPEGALHIVRNLGGRGFLFVVWRDPAFKDQEQVEAFLKMLAHEDISLKKPQP